MNDKEVLFCTAITTYVNIDGRDEDVRIGVDPAMLFTTSVMPGTPINPADFVPGIAVKVSKGRSLCINLLMPGDQALDYLNAVAACVIRSAPEKLDQALEMVKVVMVDALKDATIGPGCEGRVQGGRDAPVENS